MDLILGAPEPDQPHLVADVELQDHAPIVKCFVAVWRPHQLLLAKFSAEVHAIRADFSLAWTVVDEDDSCHGVRYPRRVCPGKRRNVHSASLQSAAYFIKRASKKCCVWFSNTKHTRVQMDDEEAERPVPQTRIGLRYV